MDQEREAVLSLFTKIHGVGLQTAQQLYAQVRGGGGRNCKSERRKGEAGEKEGGRQERKKADEKAGAEEGRSGGRKDEGIVKFITGERLCQQET